MMKLKSYPQKLELHSSDKEYGSQEVDDNGTEEIDDYEPDKVLSRNKKRQDRVTNNEECISNKRPRSFKGIKVLSASAPASVSSQG